MEDDEIIKVWERFTKKIKSMSKSDWSHTIVVYFMIIMLCLAFYVIGYGHATSKTITVANKIIIELVKDNSQKIDIYNEYSVGIIGYKLEMPSQVLEKTGG